MNQEEELRAENESLKAQLAALQSAQANQGSAIAGPGAKAAAQDAILLEGGVGGDLLGHGASKTEIHYHGPPETDPASLRAAYLHRVLTTTGQLSLTGIDPKAASETETRLALSAVYTALLTHTPAGKEGEPFDLERNPAREPRALSALEQLNQHPRLVLLGDPGSGKTTFVNFVALCLAGEALQRPEANLKVLTAPLPPDENARQQKEDPRPQPWTHGAILPVRIVLRDFAARSLPPAGTRATAQHLWRFIESELQAGALGAFAKPLLQELLEKGALILFDGLDEVPEAHQQRGQIKQAVEDFAATFRKCRLLVTSRTYAYQKQDWRLPGFEVTELAPFTSGQITRFVEGWYAHLVHVRNLHPDEAKGRAELLKYVIFNSDRLRELAERPLILTLMASLHAWRGGTLPEKREQLYADTVDLLLDWWESPKAVRDAAGQIIVQQPSLAEWLKIDRDKVRALLNHLAFQAHARQPDLTGTADVPQADLLNGLITLSNNPDVNPARLLEYLSQRAGLLLPRGEGVFTFPHRTFQEYLTACYLTDHDFPDQVAELARQAPNRWREVALLAGAKAARGSASVIWSLVESLCYHEPDTPNVADAWGAHLAGQTLIESANLEQVSERNQVKVSRVQRWLVHLLQKPALPALERVQAGNTLAALGDPRFAPEAWFLPKEDLLGFVEIPAGPFVMGSNPKLKENTIGEEIPQHTLELPTYWLARFPVTMAQFQAFVQETNTKFERWQYNPHANHPIVGVDWYEACKYCEWLNDKLKDSASKRFSDSSEAHRTFWDELASGKLRVTLPSEAEWEKAARGSAEPRRYPWGDEFDPEKANTRETGVNTTSAVGCFPLGASPYNILDLSGNVWEWTRSGYTDYPYNPLDGREDLADKEARRVLRGGAFGYLSDGARCSFRIFDTPAGRDDGSGFRLVVSPSS
jgi:formylglycine-generating enzyme required for sulfatase activity